MGHRHGSILRAALAAVAVLAAAPAWAQAYPDRPVRLVIGFGIGGPTDIVAHALAEQMSQTTPVKAFVDAKAGAAGNIATEAVATAAPDGYTFLIAATPLAINETLFRDFKIGRAHV